MARVGYDAHIERKGLWTVLDIKGRQDAVGARIAATLLELPVTPNSATAGDGRWLCRVGPEHWLFLAPASSESDLLTALQPEDTDPDCRVVQVSDAYEFFSITGVGTGDIMAIASPLDTRPEVFAGTAATFTEFFGIKALVVRIADGFVVAVERSYGDMIAACFAKAAGP